MPFNISPATTYAHHQWLRKWSLTLGQTGSSGGQTLTTEAQGARRGQPGTPQAGTWIILQPGWEIREGPPIEVCRLVH